MYVRPPAPVRYAPLVLGLALVGALVVFDIVAARTSIVITTVLLAAFVTSRIGTQRQTVVVALAATVSAMVSVVWNDNSFNAEYVLRTVVVAVGSWLAILAARERVANDLAVRRFAVLAAVADVNTQRRSMAEAAQAIAELVVPSVADYCVVDVIVAGEVPRFAVSASGPDADAVQLFLQQRPPHSPASEVGVGAVMTSQDPQLFAMTPELIERISADDADRAGLMRMAGSSVSVVPLCAREEVIGAVAFGLMPFSGRSFADDAQAFHEVLSGRIALALDNAGLDSGLREAERRLGAALEQLDEAVLITGGDGTVLYVNHAALELLRCDRVGPVGLTNEALGKITFRNSDGRVLSGEELPWGGGFRGDFDPVLVQMGEPGARQWLLLKASTVADDENEVDQIVTVLDDVTALKHEEVRARLLADVSSVLASYSNEAIMLQTVAEQVASALSVTCVIDVVGGELGSARALSASAAGREHLVLASDRSSTFELRAGDQHFGTMTVSGRSVESPTLQQVARNLSQGLLSGRLSREREVTNAVLQRGLRPPVLAELPDWSVGAMYRPASRHDEVGGDFYDLFETPAGWVAVIGDVTGHGARAARLKGEPRGVPCRHRADRRSADRDTPAQPDAPRRARPLACDAGVRAAADRCVERDRGDPMRASRAAAGPSRRIGGRARPGRSVAGRVRRQPMGVPDRGR
ncbi:MAG TPA: hypothetical protein PKB03_04825 [Baekduia sp.]|nr:hypothetical protein [Baekduia sp.]